MAENHGLLAEIPPLSNLGTYSYLIGTWTATTLYGISLVLLCMAFRIVLRRWKKGLGLNILLTVGALLLFATTTTSIVMQCNADLIGLLYTTGVEQELYFLTASTWEQVSLSIFRSANTVVGDAMLLYRAWVVWNRSWLIVLPNLLLFLGVFAACIVKVQVQAAYALNPLDSSLFDKFSQWTTVGYSLSAAQTMVGTFLIVLKIWQVDRRAGSLRENSFFPVIRIVAESGALYSASLLALTIVLATGTAAVDFLVQIIPAITSISFYLITVRVGLRNEARTNTTTNVTTNTTTGSSTGSGVAVRQEVRIHRLEDGEGRDDFGMNEFKNSSASQLDAEK